MGNKTLAFMYIGESHGFHGEKFNFSTKDIFDVRVGDEGRLVLSREQYKKKLPDHFWGNDIEAMNLLVGENGAGKTTVIRLICQWVCKLSEKRLPRETGILVFKVEKELGYIAFSNGERMSIITDIRQVEFSEQDHFANFFQDLSLVYCSNTMTELKISGYDIFQDFSLPARMRKANANGHAMGEDITGNYECYEFDRQITVALEDDKFPIDYILLEIPICSSDVFDSLLSYQKETIGQELNDILKGRGLNYNRKNGSKTDFLKIRLSHAFFIGILVRLFEWGKEHQCDGRNSVEEALNTLSSNIFADYYSSQNEQEKIKGFLGDLLKCCSELYQNSNYNDVYSSYWGDMKSYVDKVLEFIKDKQNDKFFDGWTAEEITEKMDGEKCIWKMRLKENKKSFSGFWEIYKQKASLIDSIHFSWDASSGQKNWAQLFSVLKSVKSSQGNEPESGKYDKTVWYFLDEPDNTFHPERERILIDEIRKTLNDGCGKKQIWISTHSPIMLSDMPEQAVTCLINISKGNKMVDTSKKHTFGQNIYTLYNDAFFLQNGVIGEFASNKIIDTVMKLEEIERKLRNQQRQRSQQQTDLSEISLEIAECEEITHMIAEPLFGKQIRYYLKSCKKLMERVSKSD